VYIFESMLAQQTTVVAHTHTGVLTLLAAGPHKAAQLSSRHRFPHTCTPVSCLAAVGRRPTTSSSRRRAAQQQQQRRRQVQEQQQWRGSGGGGGWPLERCAIYLLGHHTPQRLRGGECADCQQGCTWACQRMQRSAGEEWAGQVMGPPALHVHSICLLPTHILTHPPTHTHTPFTHPPTPPHTLTLCCATSGACGCRAKPVGLHPRVERSSARPRPPAADTHPDSSRQRA
jgi:hypothetical protein